DYFHDGKADSQNSESRFETCQSLWQRMKAETERVQEDLNTNILDSLLEFARKSTASFQSKTDDWASRMRARVQFEATDEQTKCEKESGLGEGMGSLQVRLPERG
ncbi:UNVERIFIED_CONTAM: hypothetical protein FKN15_004293, partial [Acipenser sinensis]